MKKVLMILLCGTFVFGANQIVNAIELNSAKDIHIYLRENFTYTNDVVTKGHDEYVQRPEILEFSKAGDCDDFAIYTWAKLTKSHYYAQPYCLYLEYNKEIVGHAITVFLDDDGTYSVFSNQLLLTTNKTNPIDAIKNIYPTWKIIFLWNPTHFGQVTRADFNKDLSIQAQCDLKELSNFVLHKGKLIK